MGEQQPLKVSCYGSLLATTTNGLLFLDYSTRRIWSYLDLFGISGATALHYTAILYDRQHRPDIPVHHKILGAFFEENYKTLISGF